MIRPTATAVVYLCVAPTDLRKQAASLALLVEQSLKRDVFAPEPDAALLAPVCKLYEIAEGAICRVDVVVVRYIVPAVAAWRRLKRHEPDSCDAETLQVVEFLNQTLEVPDPVPVAVTKGPNVRFINHRVLVPVRLNVDCLRIDGSSLPRHLGGGHEPTTFVVGIS